MEGTLINAGAVILGSIAGLIIHSRLPKNIVSIVFQGIGLFTLFLGISMASKTSDFLIMIFSIVIGSIIGELLDIDKSVNRFGEWLKKKVKSKNEKFSEGFVTSFLLFCMGSMTILGAFEEGLGGEPNLLLAKSVLDMFGSIILSASLGIGVIFSVIPLVVYQGGLTLFAGSLTGFLTDPIINELTAVGGLLLIGLGINILEIKKIKILNMIPSLIIVVILAYFFI
jgi:uncharacterized membrane protein YqgA involved in biofilm formation